VGAEVGVSVVVWASTECSDLVVFTRTVLSRSIRHYYIHAVHTTVTHTVPPSSSGHFINAVRTQ
jgi:hypothetical protein